MGFKKYQSTEKIEVVPKKLAEELEDEKKTAGERKSLLSKLDELEAE